jgi:apolipoprotein N-acyltransferase
MPALRAPVVWLLRYLTGYRPRHLVALVIALAVTLGAVAVPFWWLGEQAGSALGPAGFAIVAVIYLLASALAMLLAAVVVIRLLLVRIRRRFA